jgi:ATP-dependent Lon protease
MLTGGFYAEVDLEYDRRHRPASRAGPVRIESIRPIQMSTRDALDTFIRGRRVHPRRVARLAAAQVGFEPSQAHPPRSRTSCCCAWSRSSSATTTVELGPRGTGKSHLFQQVSPYAHLVSGGKATVAKMFVNNANGQRGLVCQYDVVCFDEVSGVSFDQKDGVNIMKGYMESGEFSRGKESIKADGGIVMVGNFDVDVEHQQRVGHLLGRCPRRCATTPRSWTASTPTCPAGTSRSSTRPTSPTTSASSATSSPSAGAAALPAALKRSRGASSSAAR